MTRSLIQRGEVAERSRVGELMVPLRAGLGLAARRSPGFRGKGRLCAWLDRLLRIGHARDSAFDIDGVRFVLNTAELNDFRLLYGLDRGVSDYLVNEVRREQNLVVWDIGANVGSVSLALAARCPTARVVAVEASPSVGRRLARNVSANPQLATRIHVLPAALGDATGTTEFFESAESFNGGVGRIRAAGNTVSHPVAVPIWRGDDLIAQGDLPAPAIIKIDIEGFEEPALRGLAGYLAARGPQLIFEHEPYRLTSADNPPSPVQFLRELGYEFRVLVGDATGPSLAALPTTRCDLVAHRLAVSSRT